MKRGTEQGGSYFVVAAFIVVGLLAVSALVFGIGGLANIRTQLRLTANATGLVFLNAYIGRPEENKTREETALGAANELLELRGRTTNFNESLGTLSLDSENPGSAGVVEPGVWYGTKPPGQSDPCGGSYPCFKPNETPVNAARTTLRSSGLGKVFLPFASILGGVGDTFSESSVAALMPRCTLFALDSSGSASRMSHPPNPCGGLFSYMIEEPDQPLPDDSATVAAFNNCSLNMDFQANWCPSASGNAQGYIAGENRPINQCLPEDPPLTPHYKSDYTFLAVPLPMEGLPGESNTARYTRYLVDTRTVPQPLATFLNAFNAATQQLTQFRAVGDATGLLTFDRFIEGNTGLVPDSDMILQLTNVRNGGFGNPVVRPNFFDWGGFPQPRGVGATQRSFTNLIAALEHSMSLFWDPDVCLPQARRNLVIASDGVGNCVDTELIPPSQCFNPTTKKCPNGQPLHGDLNNPCVSCAQRFACQDDFRYYRLMEQQIMAPVVRRYRALGSGRELNKDEPGILVRLRESGIQVTTMLYSDLIDVRIKDMVDPEGRPVSPSRAAALGHDGLPYNTGIGQSGFSPFVYWTSAISEKNAAGFVSLADADKADYWRWKQKSYTTCQSSLERSPYKFARSSGLMAEISFRTGGLYCPLLPRLPGDEGSYEQDPEDPQAPKRLRRGRGGLWWIQKSLTWRTPQEQAYDCMAEMLGGNPFALQERWDS